MDERYLKPHPGTRWAISREIGGRRVHLIEGLPLESLGDAEAVLRCLGIPVTAATLNCYFPKGETGRRCPTLELLELCNSLDPTNPVFLKQQQERGV